MGDTRDEFVKTMDTYYPLEKYVFSKPKRLDGKTLTRLMKDIHYKKDGNLWLTIKGGAGEVSMMYDEFSDYYKRFIREALVEDFGADNWQALYTETEDDTQLREALRRQVEAITEKDGDCRAREDAPEETLRLLDGIVADPREKAIELVNAYFDGKEIEVMDKAHGVTTWTSINDKGLWTYLGEFCRNVGKYRIKEDKECAYTMK